MRTSLLPAACGAATLSSQYARASLRSNGTTKPTLAPSCTQACRIWASRSTVLASAAGSIAATIIVWASMISPENENVARGALPVRNETARAHKLEAKAVAGVQAMDGPLDGQFQSAVHEKEMMFETQTWRKGVVDARADRQFAGQKLAVEADRRRRDQPAAEAGGRIDPFPLFAPPDKRRRVALDVGEQARDGRAMRSCEPSEHGGCRADFAVLDPRQGGAAHSAQRGKLIERPAPRSPQCAQTFGEAHIGGVARLGLVFHIWKILSQMRTSSWSPDGRIACEAV